jgi:nitrilase
VGSRTDAGRDQFLAYSKSAVDLGDTPNGAGDDWIKGNLPVNPETGRRGDGTREYLEDVARETDVFIITGVVEKTAGSLYCAAVYVDPRRGIIGKRRKVMPTGSERLVWAQGQPSTLKAVTATIKGVRVVMGCAICWENYMPLLRYSLYSQGVNLWLAPTADPRDTWEALMRTVACEGRCFVLSSNQCIKQRNLPSWITGQTSSSPEQEQEGSNSDTHRRPSSISPQGVRVHETLANGITATAASGAPGRRLSMTRTQENHEIAWKGNENGPIQESEDNNHGDGEKKTQSSGVVSSDPGEQFASVGGSCIVNPMGKTVAGPVWEKEDDLLYAEVDFDDCDRGHLDFDAAGHYSRPDAFKLTVEGLDLNPPP